MALTIFIKTLFLSFFLFACTQTTDGLFVEPSYQTPNSFDCRDYSNLTNTQYNGGILCDPCYRWGYLGCSSSAYACKPVLGIEVNVSFTTENFCVCATGYTPSFSPGQPPSFNSGAPPPTCEACAPNCNSCDQTGPGFCDKTGCATGFTWHNQACLSCAPNCNSCDTNGPGFCDPGQCAQPYGYTSAGCELPCGNANWCCHDWFQSVYYLSQTGSCPGIAVIGTSCDNCCSDPTHTCL